MNTTENEVKIDALDRMISRLAPVLEELRRDPAIDGIEYAAAVEKMGRFMAAEAAEIRGDPID